MEFAPKNLSLRDLTKGIKDGTVNVYRNSL